jgi:hypothetical protein
MSEGRGIRHARRDNVQEPQFVVSATCGSRSRSDAVQGAAAKGVGQKVSSAPPPAARQSQQVSIIKLDQETSSTWAALL